MHSHLAAQTNAQPINCWQCKHFAITWDPKLPYQCKTMGFKSRTLPSQQVLLLDGRACQGFQVKKPLLLQGGA